MKTRTKRRRNPSTVTYLVVVNGRERAEKIPTLREALAIGEDVLNTEWKSGRAPKISICGVNSADMSKMSDSELLRHTPFWCIYETDSFGRWRDFGDFR